MSPAADDEPRVGERDILGSLERLSRSSGTESAKTVWIALGSNVLVGVAKSIAAVLTGSASMLAEAAHSWADTGNEVFLLVANRRSRRPPDPAHPLGHGREAYVWSLLAALGLFVAGAAVSVTHGIQELITPEPATDFLVGYVVLALAFVLEGISFLRSVRQARATAELFGYDLIEEVMDTSDPTLRAVFFEDAAALVGLVIATIGLAAHQATGSSTPDAVGSILVGVLLAVVAIVLINRNRQFLVGEETDPACVPPRSGRCSSCPRSLGLPIYGWKSSGRACCTSSATSISSETTPSPTSQSGYGRSSRGSAPLPRRRGPC